ncbi:hypothetical protein HDU97_003650 [Phlyctochytrium planicorne]|nr:hypothetical protein HDU97_003650 [Phlyctochytrium planicorne]
MERVPPLNMGTGRPSVRFIEDLKSSIILIPSQNLNTSERKSRIERKSVPASTQLEKALSPSLLSELENVRSSKRPDSRQNAKIKYLTHANARSFHIPKDSQGIALGILRETLPAKEQKIEMERRLLRQNEARRASKVLKAPIPLPMPGTSRRQSMAGGVTEGVGSYVLPATAVTATAIPLPGRRASILEPSVASKAQRKSISLGGMLEEEHEDDQENTIGERAGSTSETEALKSIHERPDSSDEGYFQWKQQLKRRASSFSNAITPFRNAKSPLDRERAYCLDDFIILRKMLTGTVAFGGGNILDTIATILGGQRRREKDDFSEAPEPEGTSHRSKAMLKDELRGRPMITLPQQYRNLSDMYNLSRPAEDIVRRLMEVFPQQRMTSLRGCVDIKAHPWLRNVATTWREVEDGKLEPPFRPGNEEDEVLLSSLGNGGNKQKIEHTTNRMSIEVIGTDFVSGDGQILRGVSDEDANAQLFSVW